MNNKVIKKDYKVEHNCQFNSHQNELIDKNAVNDVGHYVSDTKQDLNNTTNNTNNNLHCNKGLFKFVSEIEVKHAKPEEKVKII